MDSEPVVVGATVVALNGETLGHIREVRPHFILVATAGVHGELTVPLHAIVRRDGDHVHLSVNREALSPVDDEEAAGRRLERTP